MTTSTINARPHTTGAFARVANVARLHLVNTGQILVVPWLILGFIFSIWWLIGLLLWSNLSEEQIANASEGMQYNGSLGYFLVYMLILAVMAISQTFPFAQSYSVTRRDFYFGTVLAFTLLSATHSILITLLGWIEDLSIGWGVNVVFFSPDYLGDNLLSRFALIFIMFLFFFMLGMAVASVYVRWRVNGMLIFFASLTVLVLGLVFLATMSGSWPAVGAWFAATGFAGVVTWSLVPTVLATFFGFVLLRRATPRN